MKWSLSFHLLSSWFSRPYILSLFTLQNKIGIVNNTNNFAPQVCALQRGSNFWVCGWNTKVNLCFQFSLFLTIFPGFPLGALPCFPGLKEFTISEKLSFVFLFMPLFTPPKPNFASYHKKKETHLTNQYDTLLHIMCGYQCDKAMNKNDTREEIRYNFTEWNDIISLHGFELPIKQSVIIWLDQSGSTLYFRF